MPLNNVTVTKGTGGLSRPLATKTQYSGYLHYEDSLTLPSGWDTVTQVEQVFSIDEVESLGLTQGSTSSIAWYHANEYFRIHPQGVLFMSLQEGSGTSSYTFSPELVNLSNISEGTLRQCLVYAPTASTTSYVETLQTIATNDFEGVYRPCQFILDGTNNTYGNLTSIPDFTGSGDQRKNVSIVVGCDLGAVSGASASAAGTALGAISLSQLQENIGWVQKFNIASGTYFDNPGIITGEKLRDVSDTQLEALKNKSLIAIRKINDYTGIYFTDDTTCASSNSDYKEVSKNRVIDEAVRLVRLALVPSINSPLYLKDDGSIDSGTIKGFEASAERPLTTMKNRGEISNFLVTIDPTQDVSDSELDISIAIQPVLVSRYINVVIQFKLSIA